MLADHQIQDAIHEGHLGIHPYNPTLVQPASLDVRLGESFRIFDNHDRACIDPLEETPTRLVNVEPGNHFMLHPGQFVLGTTVERVELPDWMCARVEGKSSLGRLGLLTHATAGFIDPGFRGQITLELSNVATLPIRLRPGMLVAQLCFSRMDEPVAVPYGSAGLGSHYQDQLGPTGSGSHVTRGVAGIEKGPTR